MPAGADAGQPAPLGQITGALLANGSRISALGAAGLGQETLGVVGGSCAPAEPFELFAQLGVAAVNPQLYRSLTGSEHLCGFRDAEPGHLVS